MNTTRCVRLVLGVVLTLVVLLGAWPAWAQSAPATSSPGHWPRFQHDACNSGATDEALPAAFLARQDAKLRILWKRPFQEWSHTFAQPVVANGRVYYAVMDGGVYCLDAASGKDLWQYPADTAVAVTPDVSAGKLYAGDFGGNVFCLDPATGQELWRYRTGGAIYSSPCVADGKVFIGSNDRRLYALDAASGKLLWSFLTGGIIDANPACFEGRVYFTSEDMNVYCVDAADGREVWRKRLFGASNRGNHPVISAATRTVALSTMPLMLADRATGCSIKSQYFNELKGGEIIEGKYFVRGDKASGQMPWDYLRENPWRQCIYILDARTGREVTGFTRGGQEFERLWFNQWYGNVAPPVVRPADGAFIFQNHSLDSVDPQSRQWKQIAKDGQWRGDEANPYIVLGEDRILGGFRDSIATVDLAGGKNRSLFRGKVFGQEDIEKERPIPGGHFVTGIGDADGKSSGYTTFAGGRIYYPCAGWLFCLEPDTSGRAASQPVAEVIPPPKPARPAATSQPAEIRAALVASLRGQIGRLLEDAGKDERIQYPIRGNWDLMVGGKEAFREKLLTLRDGGHYGPGVMLTDDVKGQLWFEGQIISALARTLAYLDEPQRNALAKYLKSEVEQYLLKEENYRFEEEFFIEYYSPEWPRYNSWPLWQSLSGLYAYAQATGDWDTLGKNWDFIAARYAQGRATTVSPTLRTGAWPFAFNAELSGLLAVSAMAEKLGHADLAQDARSKADRLGQLVAQGWQMDQKNPYPLRSVKVLYAQKTGGLAVGHDDKRGWHFVPYFMHLSPASAQWWKTNRAAWTAEYVQRFEQYNKWWWMNNYNHGFDAEEGPWQRPTLAYAVFQAKARVLNEPVDSLARQLPWPLSYGYLPDFRDVFWYENVTALLERIDAQR